MKYSVPMFELGLRGKHLHDWSGLMDNILKCESNVFVVTPGQIKYKDYKSFYTTLMQAFVRYRIQIRTVAIDSDTILCMLK